MKIWFGNSLGSKTPTISLLFGADVDYDQDGSMNESISCEETPDNKLTLMLMFNMFGDKGPHDPKSIVNEIWKSHLLITSVRNQLELYNFRKKNSRV
ncbi:hypothetical protein [Paenibacillus sp. P36]|uniref:hypothetical protein n=1 Tax=Paenibacillus sp. P36 TaxID=3342538 RepID=UPI0038B32384